MSDTATISFRTDPAIKREARELYADMGMDLSTAINIFLRQSIRENGMPFKITRDNPSSIEARRQTETHTWPCSITRPGTRGKGQGCGADPIKT